MSRQFILLIAAGFLLIFAAGVAAVFSINNLSQSGANSPALVSSAGAVVVPLAIQPTAVLVTTPGISATKTVQRSDIDQLAAAVSLYGTPTTDKAVWARETPIAQQLLTGMGDHAQQYWLRHFIETGEEVSSGSPKFAESLKILATLRRSNEDFVSQAAH